VGGRGRGRSTGSLGSQVYLDQGKDPALRWGREYTRMNNPSILAFSISPRR
jgi:hypothetical protein